MAPSLQHLTVLAIMAFFFFWPFLKWHAPRVPLNSSVCELNNVCEFNNVWEKPPLKYYICSFGVTDLFKLAVALPFSLN